VRIGFQYESILGTEIRGDFYFGAGLRRATNIVATYLDNYYNNQPPAYDTVKEKYFLPQIIAGIKLGFPF
jgi:hypothetical protein